MRAKGATVDAMSKSVHKATLVVRSARYADVYKDTVRISEADRGPLRLGKIHRFTHGKCSTYAVLRGLAPVRQGQILMDEAVRFRLEAKFGELQEFTISEASFWGQLVWGWSATDPTYSAATRLGVLSVGLGALSLLLTLPTLFEIFSDVVRFVGNLNGLTCSWNR